MKNNTNKKCCDILRIIKRKMYLHKNILYIVILANAGEVLNVSPSCWWHFDTK